MCSRIGTRTGRLGTSSARDYHETKYIFEQLQHAERQIGFGRFRYVIAYTRLVIFGFLADGIVWHIFFAESIHDL